MPHILDVIKYEGDGSTFVWKHPCEDFNAFSQLIVHESQWAVFMYEGRVQDVLGPGRHTLDTMNLPVLGKVLNWAVGGESPFHCEVYFVSKTVQMAVKWGTPDKVRFLEPNYGVPLEIGASGELELAVCDPGKLLVKLVGTTNGIAWEDRDSDGFARSLKNSFRPLITSSVKTHLPAAIRRDNLDVLEIDTHLTELAAGLQEAIRPGFAEYGLAVPNLYITNVVLPESDPNFKRIKELHSVYIQTRMVQAETVVKSAQAESDAAVLAARRKAELERQTTQTEIARMEAERELIKAQTQAQSARMQGYAEADVMRAKGYSEKDVLQADVQKAYAEGIGMMSAGGGSVVGDVVSLGAGLAAAGHISAQMGEMFKGFEQPAAQGTPVAEKAVAAEEALLCPACGKALPSGAKFCLECGAKVETLAENEMLCPACGKKTPKGKFCIECGAPLVNRCPQCGIELPEGARFCSECGFKLQ